MTVAKALLTVTPDTLSIPAGTAPPDYNLPANYTITGFVAPDSQENVVITGTPGFQDAASISSGPGIYAITSSNPTLSASAGDYKFTYDTSNLTITAATGVQQATTTVLTVPSGTVTYGPIETLKATVTAAGAGGGTPPGTVNFMNGSTVLGSATLVGGVATYPAQLAAGTYSLTADYIGNSQFANSNSTPAQALMVTKAPLTVTALNEFMTQGSPVPNLNVPADYAITGFVNLDQQSTAVSGAPVLTPVNLSSSSPPGMYTISIAAGNLSATNYSFNTFVPGTLTVLAATGSPQPTMTALQVSDGSLSYGQTETLTATVTTDGAGVPTGGSVTFSANDVQLGPAVTLTSNGTAQLPTAALALGMNVVTASYSGAAGFAASSTPVTTAGIITTVAGGGVGDGGLATDAVLTLPAGVAVDKAGDVFIADAGGNRIREINATTHVITTIAGNGTPGSSGDQGLATAAELNDPSGVAVGNNGDLFIADTGNSEIREVIPAAGSATGSYTNATINTIAGTGDAGYSGDGGLATAAELFNPTGVAVDASGNNLFIADSASNRVRWVNLQNNMINLVAGNGTAGYVGVTGASTAGELDDPEGVAVDAQGDIFIADSGNAVIREVTPAQGGSFANSTITTVAGGGTNPALTATIPATQAELGFSPFGVAVDGSGDLFISDTGNSVIREVKLGASPPTISTLAIGADLSSPEGVAVDASGNLFIVDTNNSVVREVVHSTNTINTIAGDGSTTYGGDGNPATTATLNSPEGVAFDRAGDLFIADTLNNVIREVSAEGVITTVVGDGQSGEGADGDQATAAELNGPTGVAVDMATGALFIADSGNGLVEQVTPAGNNYADGTFTIVTGEGGTSPLTGSMPAAGALLNDPQDVAVDASGNLFIADTGDNVVCEIKPLASGSYAGSTITTVAGDGTAGYYDDVPATAAELNGPAAVAVDAAGDLFIADTQNNVVREVTGGQIKTIAGVYLNSGVPTDGTAAGTAAIGDPDGLAVDSLGNLYIADDQNDLVYDVTDGQISTVVGQFNPAGESGYSGDNGPATAAELDGAAGLGVDSSGNLFIADSINNAIREVTATTGAQTVDVTSSQTTTVLNISAASLTYGASEMLTATVSTNPASGTAPSGTVTFMDGQTKLGQPVTLSASGTATYTTTGLTVGMHTLTALYNGAAGFASSSTATAVGTLSTITTVAGNGTQGNIGDSGGSATAAELSDPDAVAVDSSGHLFIADSRNNVIEEVNLAAHTITTIAGGGSSTSLTGSALATSVALSDPLGIAVDSSGNIFIADAGSDHVVREIVPSNGSYVGATITTVAGGGTAALTTSSQSATAVALARPGASRSIAGMTSSLPTKRRVWSKRSTSGRIRSRRSPAAARIPQRTLQGWPRTPT